MSVADAYLKIRDRVQEAALRCGRDPKSIRILPVSKGQSIEKIREGLAHPEFPHRLGENYSDELEQKHRALGNSVEWHYLGRLQSRKVADICSQASVIHTVTRIKEVEILAKQRSSVRFFLQVNVSEEGQKNGCEIGELPTLVEACEKHGVKPSLMGLMTLPATFDNVGESVLRKQFSALRSLRDRFVPGGALSMGMSDDFEWAIQEGSDWIRIGTAIFGSRT